MHSRVRASAGPTLADVQAAGFPMGGEALAVDLADTLVTVTSPSTDLLADRAAAKAFWTIHGGLLPAGWAFPALTDTRRLRDAVRVLFDAAEQHRSLDRPSLDTVNAFSALVSRSDEVALEDGRLHRLECWHYTNRSDLPLAAAARSAIDLLTVPTLLASLRRCASPTCSMLFATGDARRRWCTPNICGNRDRAARHYRRHKDNPS